MCNPERLVYWYLRLNGFLLLEDFIVHPDEGSNQRTDVDLIGVRFKSRIENSKHPMIDDLKVIACPTLCNVILAEVKTDICSLNGAWKNRELENMQRVLRAIGCFSKSDIEKAAGNIYENGVFSNDRVTCRIVVFGDREGVLEIPKVPQIMFDDVICFLHNRFVSYRPQKSCTATWASDGERLKKLAFENRDIRDFSVKARRLFKLKCTTGDV